MRTPSFDLIVVGLGAFGASTALAAARKGLRVLALDAHAPGGAKSLSYGETRLFRQIYAEHPKFYSLTQQALPLWESLQEFSEKNLFHRPGHLNLFSKSNFLSFKKSLNFASRNEIDHQVLNSIPNHHALLENKAFVINVEAYFETTLRLLKDHQALILLNDPVTQVVDNTEEIQIVSRSGKYFAKSVVVSAGAQIPWFLPARLPTIKYEKLPVVWYDLQNVESQFSDLIKYNSFSVKNGKGYFFAIRNISRNLLKIFNHEPVQFSPSLKNINRSWIESEADPIKNFALDYLGLDTRNIIKRHVGLACTTENAQFVIKRVTPDSNIIIAGGDSGHAFKFAPLLGLKIMDELNI